MPTYKDINLLTQKATIAGTEKIPVSDTEYVTPFDITKEINLEVFGKIDIPKDYVWSNGYVGGDTIYASSLSQFCQPILFHAGEKITYKTGSEYGSAIVQARDNTPISVGSTGFVIQILLIAQTANIQYQYTFQSDMWVVISVYKADYELHTFIESQGESLDDRVSALESEIGDIATILASI